MNVGMVEELGSRQRPWPGPGPGPASAGLQLTAFAPLRLPACEGGLEMSSAEARAKASAGARVATNTRISKQMALHDVITI